MGRILLQPESATHNGIEIRDCHAPVELFPENLGYLLAMRDGAEVIVETDDDNRPLEGFWKRRCCSGRRPVVECDGEWFNVPNEFLQAGSSIWPRGYPLDLIHADAKPHIDNCARQNPDTAGFYRR